MGDNGIKDGKSTKVDPNTLQLAGEPQTLPNCDKAIVILEKILSVNSDIKDMLSQIVSENTALVRTHEADADSASEVFEAETAGECDGTNWKSEYESLNEAFQKIFQCDERISEEALKSAVQNLRNSIDQQNEQIKKLERNRDSAENNYQTANGQLLDLNKEFQNLFLSKDNISVDSLRRAVCSLQDDIAEEQKKNGILQQELEDEKSNAKKLQQCLGALTKAYQDFDGKDMDCLTADALKAKLEENANSIRAKNKEIEEKEYSIGILKSEIKEKNNVIRAKEEELSQRFQAGWSVYQTYRNIEENPLSAKNFTEFIVRSAKMANLDFIWDEIRKQQKAGADDVAKILWESFRYAVDLVNAVEGQTSIEILEPKVGDRYDSDIHNTTGTNSKTQGTVREVILPGFRNNNSKKTVRKNIVRVG